MPKGHPVNGVNKGWFKKGEAVQLGFRHSEATKKKLSEYTKAHPISFWKGKKRLHMTDEKHWYWKGDDVAYGSLHDWLKRKLGDAKDCSVCGGTRNSVAFQWANISREYKRDLTDWIELCASCHKKMDSNNWTVEKLIEWVKSENKYVDRN